MNFDKRMHRFNKIEITDSPVDIEKWLTSQKYSDERITVFKLRNMIMIDPVDQKNFYKDLQKQMSKVEKDKSKMIVNRIDKETDLNWFIDFLDSNEHKELSLRIIKRMLAIDEKSYCYYLNLLKKKYTDNQFDCILQILTETIRIKDVAEEIFNIMKEDYVRDPQDFASLTQILGLSNSFELNYLYSFYIYFKNNFPDNNYFEGPLFGISYYLERRRRTTGST